MHKVHRTSQMRDLTARRRALSTVLWDYVGTRLYFFNGPVNEHGYYDKKDFVPICHQ